MNAWVGGWIISVCMCVWMDRYGWMNVDGWVDEGMSGWISDLMGGWMNRWTDRGMNR